MIRRTPVAFGVGGLGEGAEKTDKGAFQMRFRVALLTIVVIAIVVNAFRCRGGAWRSPERQAAAPAPPKPGHHRPLF